MRYFPPQRFVALILLLVITTVSASGFCREADVRTLVQKADGCSLKAEPGKECPACPDESGSTTGGCDSCLSCPCHAPLTAQFTHPAYSPVVASIATFERLKYLPEVYLPKFIPPHILA